MAQQLYIKDWFGRNLRMDFDLRNLDHGKFNFLLLMCRRMNERRGMSHKDGEKLMREAKSNFYSLEIEFGDPDYEWTPNAAFELADEFCEYDDD